MGNNDNPFSNRIHPVMWITVEQCGALSSSMTICRVL